MKFYISLKNRFKLPVRSFSKLSFNLSNYSNVYPETDPPKFDFRDLWDFELPLWILLFESASVFESLVSLMFHADCSLTSDEIICDEYFYSVISRPEHASDIELECIQWRFPVIPLVYHSFENVYRHQNLIRNHPRLNYLCKSRFKSRCGSDVSTETQAFVSSPWSPLSIWSPLGIWSPPQHLKTPQNMKPPQPNVPRNVIYVMKWCNYDVWVNDEMILSETQVYR
jgi:hypothetical protein